MCRCTSIRTPLAFAAARTAAAAPGDDAASVVAVSATALPRSILRRVIPCDESRIVIGPPGGRFSAARSPRSVGLDPVQEDAGDLVAVVLPHHEVAVAPDPAIVDQVEVCGVAPRGV